MTIDRKSRATPLIAFVVLSVAVAGYFTGLQAPMKVAVPNSTVTGDVGDAHLTTTLEAGVVSAPYYKDMAKITLSRRHHAQLASLKSAIEPLAEIQIDSQEKLARRCISASRIEPLTVLRPRFLTRLINGRTHHALRVTRRER